MSNHTTRRRFIKTLPLLSVVPSLVQGSRFLRHQPVPRIGYLSGAGVPELEKAFIEELQKLGFNERKLSASKKGLPDPTRRMQQQ